MDITVTLYWKEGSLLDPGEDDPDDGQPLEFLPREGKDYVAEARSLRHLLVHMPKNPWCAACQKAKMQRKPCPGRPLGAVPAAFGDQLTADHIIARSERSQGVTGQEDALLVMDRATKWVDCFPLKDKSAENARVSN